MTSKRREIRPRGDGGVVDSVIDVDLVVVRRRPIEIACDFWVSRFCNTVVDSTSPANIRVAQRSPCR